MLDLKIRYTNISVSRTSIWLFCTVCLLALLSGCGGGSSSSSSNTNAVAAPPTTDSSQTPATPGSTATSSTAGFEISLINVEATQSGQSSNVAVASGAVNSEGVLVIDLAPESFSLSSTTVAPNTTIGSANQLCGDGKRVVDWDDFRALTGEPDNFRQAISSANLALPSGSTGPTMARVLVSGAFQLSNSRVFVVANYGGNIPSDLNPLDRLFNTQLVLLDSASDHPVLCRNS